MFIYYSAILYYCLHIVTMGLILAVKSYYRNAESATASVRKLRPIMGPRGNSVWNVD